MAIYAIGHQPPDLDATVAPVAYANFLNLQKAYEDNTVIPLVSGSFNKETLYVFERFGANLPLDISTIKLNAEDKFILIDHNEEDQRPTLVVSKNIIEILDHHKININITSPIKIDIKPWGSTSTIIYDHYQKTHISIPTEIKGLILAAILSDTVGLKSPTTTNIDAKAAHELAKDLTIDINELAFSIFKAKSDLEGLTLTQIIEKDYKIGEVAGKKIFIGVVETVEQDKVLQNVEQIAIELENIKQKHQVQYAFLAVQDILNINSKVIYNTEQEKRILEIAFKASANKNIVDIGPKISRKKEIAPLIESTILSL